MFDYLVCDNIWYKLYKIGLRGNLYKVIKSLYNHVSSRVRLSGQVGESFESHLGVRQVNNSAPYYMVIFKDYSYSHIFIEVI